MTPPTTNAGLQYVFLLDDMAVVTQPAILEILSSHGVNGKVSQQICSDLFLRHGVEKKMRNEKNESGDTVTENPKKESANQPNTDAEKRREDTRFQPVESICGTIDPKMRKRLADPAATGARARARMVRSVVNIERSMRRDPSKYSPLILKPEWRSRMER